MTGTELSRQKAVQRKLTVDKEQMSRLSLPCRTGTGYGGANELIPKHALHFYIPEI